MIKKWLWVCVCLPFWLSSQEQIQTKTFDEYLVGFNYQERKDMKIDIKTLVELYKENKVQLVDIRFPEEVQCWSFPFMKNIPLNELPQKMAELDRSKIIVTVCPHYDRAAIARHYLTLNGFKSRYLVEGLLGLADYLRGDRARDFIKTASE